MCFPGAIEAVENNLKPVHREVLEIKYMPLQRGPTAISTQGAYF